MVRPTYIVLHKTEWERLQKQGRSLSEEPVNLKNEYIKALTEKSREWTKTWPDTVSVHIAPLEKQKKRQEKSNIELVKAYVSRMKQENTAAAIKKARQLIFENSSYGRKLISALLESRALDIRDAQIQFQRDLQRKAVDIAKKQEGIQNVHNFHDNAETQKREKIAALECNRVNKEIVSEKQEKELQEKLKEKECAVEDEKLMKRVLAIEEKEMDDIKRCEKEDIKEYEAQTKEIEKLKAKERELDEALTEVYKKGQDNIKSKIEVVMKNIYQGRSDTKWSKDLYKKLDGIQSESKKRYEEFVDKGIKTLEERTSIKETKEREKQKQKTSSLYLTSKKNKIAAEEERLAKMCVNKCACDRQSLNMKTNNKPLKKTEMKSDYISLKATKSDGGPCEIINLPFLAPRNKLIEELKQREKEPSPWSGAKEVHAQFAQQANEVLKEIKHKRFARKVVDEYRKFNCLDATTLPIPNY